MPETLAPLRAAYNDRIHYAKEAHSRGVRVVGYVCDNVPTELIRAAGFLPYRLNGDQGRSRDEIGDLITPVHARRFAGNEFVEAMYAPLAAGELDFLDYLVVPHNRKAVHSIIQSIEILRESAPGFKVPETHCLDRTYTRTFLTSGFNQASIFHFSAALEQWRGSPILESDLRSAIINTARTRALLREVNALRVGAEPRITGSEALLIYGASHFMESDAFHTAASAFLQHARARAGLPGVRLYMGGSPLDYLSVYEEIERLGAIIVSEDHCWGARCAEADLDGDTTPLEALARRFDRQPACSLLGSLDAITQSVQSRVAGSGAQAAIFHVIRGDMSQMWETPSQVDALRARGVPSLHLARQHYRAADMSALVQQVQTFLAPLREGTAHG